MKQPTRPERQWPTVCMILGILVAAVGGFFLGPKHHLPSAWRLKWFAILFALGTLIYMIGYKSRGPDPEE